MNDAVELMLEVERSARGSGASRAETPDLVQETLLRVWRRLEERGETGTPSGLIRTTLRRIRIDWWRSRRHVRTLEDDHEPACDLSPMDDATWRELQARVRLAIESLPAAQREVVRLRVYEGLKFREIAEVQHAPLNTVLGRMHLAMKELRRRLEASDA